MVFDARTPAEFKNQNAVRGLPLELSPDEVTLALEKGTLTAPTTAHPLALLFRFRSLHAAFTSLPAYAHI